jgi:hypothetical protein
MLDRETKTIQNKLAPENAGTKQLGSMLTFFSIMGILHKVQAQMETDMGLGI